MAEVEARWHHAHSELLDLNVLYILQRSLLTLCLEDLINDFLCRGYSEYFTMPYQYLQLSHA